MADQQAGVGGLPFSFNPKPSTSSSLSSSPASSPSSSSSPATSPPSAESTPSTTPPLPPPHLGPGGLPLAPHLSLPPHLSSPPRVRAWGEKLVYETGTSYALGFLSGGLAGTLQGLSRPLPGANAKLRLNAVLNGAGKVGSTYANGFAVFALVYGMSRSVSRWGWRRWVVGEVGPAAYVEKDDWFEGVGVAVAGSMTAYTRMPLSRALACGGVLGVLMVGGLKARRKLIDERGVKLPHI